MHLGQILETTKSGVLGIVSRCAIRPAGATRRNPSIPAREARVPVVFGAVVGGARRALALVQAIPPRICTVAAELDEGLVLWRVGDDQHGSPSCVPIEVRRRAVASADSQAGRAARGYSPATDVTSRASSGLHAPSCRINASASHSARLDVLSSRDAASGCRYLRRLGIDRARRTLYLAIRDTSGFVRQAGTSIAADAPTRTDLPRMMCPTVQDRLRVFGR